MRLFVAVTVPAHVRAVVAAAAAPARTGHPDLAWTRPDGWHVTVAFLGEVAEERVPEVSAVVAPVAATAVPVELSLAAPGRFGGRVLWLGLTEDPPGTLAALGDMTQARLTAAGLPVDPKPVRPHLTLARARRGGRVLPAVAAAMAPAAASWSADELGLYRSILGRGGARYETLATFPLAGPGN